MKGKFIKFLKLKIIYYRKLVIHRLEIQNLERNKTLIISEYRFILYHFIYIYTRLVSKVS